MAGHSKWNNIKHRKAANDKKKGKITTKIIKEITIAARNGSDPNANPKLRLAIEKAKENNVPKDNVEKAILRGSGELDGISYEEIRFEGYGILGAGLIIDCLSDNRMRTISEVRHALTKYGGNLGSDGCVLFQFNYCGQLIFDLASNDEDKLFAACLELNVEDISVQDNKYMEVIVNPSCFIEVKNKLKDMSFIYEFAEVTMKPLNEVLLNQEDSIKMQKLIDALEDLDHVQEVYTNAVLSD